MHKENQNNIVGYFNNGSGVQTAMFVTNISKEVVKNMNFDDLKAYYEKCLNDEEELKILCLNNYTRMRLDYHKDDTEADKEDLLKVIQNNADQILSQKEMAYYTYIYDNNNVALDEWYKDMDNFKNNYLYKQDLDSKIEKYDLPKFKQDIKKRVIEINKKVNKKLGKAYTILVDNEQCYIPIGRDLRLEQKL